jgi:hypothetical protein
MRKLMKNFVWTVALLLVLPSAWAFSPGGPIGNGGDNWQVPVIGYGLNGDIMAPKNIGEEYRRNVPVLYYSYDANFLGYFGLAGTTNVDMAFGLINGIMAGYGNTVLFLNSPTNGVLSTTNGLYNPNGQSVLLTPTNNLDSYSVDLSEFPLVAQQYNLTAYALGLIDLKSVVLNTLVENLGLADPVRFNWTLHNRYQPTGTTCPNSTEYIVVQRNLDYLNSSLQSVQYSPYINGTLYSYQIFEDCTLAGTIPSTADPFSLNSPVASDWDVASGNFFYLTGLQFGGYYGGLTRDDVAGLRYLLTSNNIKTEATAPNNSFLLLTNVQSQQTLTTLPIGLFFAQAATNDPSTLQSNYPGITFLSVATNIVTRITPTPVPYFTNLPPPYTNYVPFVSGVSVFTNNSVVYTNIYGMSVYQTNGIVPFTNWSPVQYADPPIRWDTLPLGLLLALAPNTDPVTLQALYPGLVFAVTTNYLGVQVVTNVFPYYTNLVSSAVFTNNNGTTNRFPLPQVTSLTNIYYFTNQPGSPIINYDITVGFTKLSTLDLANFVDLSRTNPPATMLALYPGLQILRSTTFPSYVAVTNYVSYLTNTTGSPYQGPPKLVTKPVSTNYLWVTNWNYTFGNVITNHYSTNRYITTQSIWITNQIGAPYGSPFIAKTNYTTVKTNQISGDFFLIPTNWCGFDLVEAQPLPTPPYTYGITNTIIYNGYNTNGSVGTNFTVGGNAYGLIQNIYDLYTNYNYAVYPGICMPTLRFGTNYTTNVVYQYQYNFYNIITNHYYSNSLVTAVTTNTAYIPFGSPDLLTNIVTTNTYVTNLPAGDFYIVPTGWCGFEILNLLANLNTQTNFVVAGGGASATNGAQGAQYNVQTYYYYTNYTYSVRAGACEPALVMATNFSTNIVTQYQYNFGNIITNSFYTNNPVYVLTTNLAIQTNGLVGTLTNIVTTNITYGGISGDFYIPPANWCSYTILRTQLQAAVFFTNTITATNAPGVTNLGQAYNQFQITAYTNTILIVQPSTCSQVAAGPALRRGVQHVLFIRANYDSLLGQYFSPITNNYTMVTITNGQPVTEFYQRVVTAPDFTLSAQDLTGGPAQIPIDPYGTRNINFDQSTVLNGLAGPGIIYPRTTFTLNKSTTTINNTGTASLTQYTNSGIGYIWGSFDGSTNPPVLYPSGTSLVNLENQVVMQVTIQSGTNVLTALPAGTNNVAYPSLNFSAQGGQPPYVWSAGNLPPGLVFDPVAQILSGTPSGAVSGVPYTVTLTLTDSVNRTVNLNYSVTIY